MNQNQNQNYSVSSYHQDWKIKNMASIYLAEDFTSQISQIVSPSSKGTGGLYLGNLKGVRNKQILKKYKITAVISILSEKEIKIQSSSISHVQIKINDSPFQNILQHIPSCIDFISKFSLTGNVFVHCVAGISRSATLVIAYLMRSRKYSLKYALSKVKRRRNIINPNKGFVLQLQQFQKKLEKDLKVKLK